MCREELGERAELSVRHPLMRRFEGDVDLYVAAEEEEEPPEGEARLDRVGPYRARLALPLALLGDTHRRCEE